MPPAPSLERAGAAASRAAHAGVSRRAPAAAAPPAPSRRRAAAAASRGRRGGVVSVSTPAQGERALTPGGVVELSPEAAEAERLRLEGTDAFAELMKLSSLAPGQTAGQPPSAASAFSAGGLKKPSWLRQRAPQGERCVRACVRTVRRRLAQTRAHAQPCALYARASSGTFPRLTCSLAAAAGMST
jgi:hypothetical protein